MHCSARLSRLLALLGLLGIIASAAAACASAEERESSGSDYMLVFVTDDGRMIGRSAESMAAITEVIEFPVVAPPADLLGSTVAYVQGVVNPPGSQVQFWYGPRESLPSSTMQEARILLTEWGPESPVRTMTRGVPTEVAGSVGRILTSGDNVTVQWEACGVSFTLAGFGIGEDATREAAELVTQRCAAP